MNRFLSFFEGIGLLAICFIVAPAAWLYGNEKATQFNNLLSQVGQADMSEYFSVSYAHLKREEGRWVVYTDGTTLQDFEGSYRVCMKDASTGRSYWTCQWADWFPYEATGKSSYRQPEPLDWWANISEAFSESILEGPKVMTTCWRAKVENVILDPKCVTSNWEPNSQQ